MSKCSHYNSIFCLNFGYLFFRDGNLNILSLYWQRYLRLTTLLAVVLLVDITIFRFFGSGPIWSRVQFEIANCHQFWWSTLLHVQNYVNPERMVSILFSFNLWANSFWLDQDHNNPISILSMPQCMISTWYLSVDMQLFFIAPVLVYSVHRFKKTTLLALLIAILCCVVYTVLNYIDKNIRHEWLYMMIISSWICVCCNLYNCYCWQVNINDRYI